MAIPKGKLLTESKPGCREGQLKYELGKKGHWLGCPILILKPIILSVISTK